MARFIHVNDIKPRERNPAGLWLNTDAIDIIEPANGGKDTEMTLRSGRVIQVVGSLELLETTCRSPGACRSFPRVVTSN